MTPLIAATRKAVDDGNWYAALSLTLMLPDIACSLEREDGRTNRKRYAEWFDTWMPAYSKAISKTHGSREFKLGPFMQGADCYALRCAFLHNGMDDIEQQRARVSITRFVFIAGKKGGHRNLIHDTLQLDVGKFASEMCQACEIWLEHFRKIAPTANEREMSLITVYDGAGGLQFKPNPEREG